MMEPGSPVAEVVVLCAYGNHLLVAYYFYKGVPARWFYLILFIHQKGVQVKGARTVVLTRMSAPSLF